MGLPFLLHILTREGKEGSRSVRMYQQEVMKRWSLRVIEFAGGEDEIMWKQVHELYTYIR